MQKLFSIAILFFLFSVQINEATAQAFHCDADIAWGRIRQIHPIHIQTLASCSDETKGATVIILTEPPPHVTRQNVRAIVGSLFQSKVLAIDTRRQTLGFDGWAQDLVLTVKTGTENEKNILSNDLTLFSTYVFGTAYKAEIEDIAKLQPVRPWSAPPSLEVSADELNEWLFGSKLLTFMPLGGGPQSSVAELVANEQTGTYLSAEPGLVIIILPISENQPLNDSYVALRQFVVDSDAIVGAAKLAEHLILVGRERTTSFQEMPPLRVETILQIAASKSIQLAQSYERNRAFSGKLLWKAGDNFGWDWAPDLLSDELIDTEYGSLLNFTDDMLKGWSESGKIQYRGAQLPVPSNFPFGAEGAFSFLKADSLTYNWNTAGVGLISTIEGRELYSIRRTGSLPVSYFPEGTADDQIIKSKLMGSEDTAYSYFSALRDPMLSRAVQYAALYQMFNYFGVHASTPQEAPARAATSESWENILEQHAKSAIELLSNPNQLGTPELSLWELYLTIGDAAKAQESLAEEIFREQTSKDRVKIADDIQTIDLKYGLGWRNDFAKELAWGIPHPEDKEDVKLGEKLQFISKVGLKLAQSSESVRSIFAASISHDPNSWISTPSIVLSRGDEAAAVGGHNIGGFATRIELDSTIAKGDVVVTGNYGTGRVIHLNPSDKVYEREIVRLFDRETGLADENMDIGARAIRERLKAVAPAARPIRRTDIALAQVIRSRAIETRGAVQNLTSTNIGFRPASFSKELASQIEKAAIEAHSNVFVTKVKEGYVIHRGQPQPSSMQLAKNEASLVESIDNATIVVSLGPPPVSKPVIRFAGFKKAEIELFAQSMSNRSKATASGGGAGKPPFGGSKGLFGEPDPMRPFSNGVNNSREFPQKQDFESGRPFGQKVREFFGAKRRVAIDITGDHRILDFTPNWKDAEIKVLNADEFVSLAAPHPSFQSHVIEISVPVALVGQPRGNVLVRAFSWFRNTLPPKTMTQVEGALRQLRNDAAGTDLKEFVIQYKSLMVNEFGSEGVYIQIFDEASAVIVTQNEIQIVRDRNG